LRFRQQHEQTVNGQDATQKVDAVDGDSERFALA
jgi:hypothetical protein